MNILLKMTEIVILAPQKPYIFDLCGYIFQLLRPKCLGMGHLTHPKWPI